MALSPVSPVINRGVVSNWLLDLPAAVEMLTVDTDGNVSHQSIPVASFAALTGAPGDNTALAAVLAGKANSVHTHSISDVTSLQTALDGKAATSHTHVIANTTGLQAALDAKIGGSTGSTDNRILRADGTGGATAQSSAVTIDDSGNLGIGQDSPNVACVIRRSGTPIPSLRLEDGDITIPMTGLSINPSLQANTVGVWSGAASSSGGMAFTGLTNNTAAAYPIIFQAIHGSASPSNPAIFFSGNKSNGGTGVTTLASTEIIAGFYNGDVTTTPVVTVAASGIITAPSIHLAGTSNNIGVEFDSDGVRLKAYSGSALMYVTTTGGGVRIAGSRELGWVSDSNSANGGTFDTRLVRDAANVVAQRNGTSAQAHRVYQSFTDSSNYHRWKVDYSGSTCRFGTERAGTGATGHMELWQNGSAIVGFNSGGKVFFHNRDITFGYWNGGNITLTQTAFSGVLNVVDAITPSTYLNIALGQLLVGGASSTTTGRIKNTSGTLNFRLGNDSADANITAASAVFSGLVTVGTYTVATLPSAAANAGALAQVTDSSVTANGSAVAGGGANRVSVYSNGSSWKVVVA